MRKFINPIFLGSGDNSKRQIQILNTTVHEGLDILCALQQPDDPTYPPQRGSVTERRELEAELKEIITDIVAAFGYTCKLRKKHSK